MVQWDPASKWLEWATANNYTADSLFGQLHKILNEVEKDGVGVWDDSVHQWQKFRVDPEMSFKNFIQSNKRVEKVFWHIPILNGNIENVDVYIPEKRFCSFGSTWNKKINASPKIITSNNNGRYLTIDATSMFTNRTERTLVYNEGLILKKPKGKNNFIAISTGDCYSAPQILEIKLKK